jgi:hypothetical protein
MWKDLPHTARLTPCARGGRREGPGRGGVRAHDELDVDAHALRGLDDLAVEGPVVLAGLALDEAPPHVGHHAVHAHLLEAPQPPLDRLHVPLV